MLGLVVSPPIYPNVAPYPYYLYPLPSIPSPPTLTPKPPMPPPPLPYNNLLYKVKFMLNRAQPIPLTQRNEIRGNVIETNNIMIIKVARVHCLMHLREAGLIPQPSNRAANPRKKGVFVQTNLFPVVAYMTIILTSVPFYLSYIKYGKPM